MPRGGARPGAGRKPNPDSARQRAIAVKTAKSKEQPSGFTLGDGRRAPDAPAAWPFGVAPASPPAAPAPPPPAEPPADRSAEPEPENALAYLQSVYRNHEDERIRLQAAALALPFETSKPLPVKGKGDTRGGAAPKVSKFASMAPPKLVASNGAKV